MNHSVWACSDAQRCIIESFFASSPHRCGPRFTQLFSASSGNPTRDASQLSPGENAPGIASVRQPICVEILFTSLLALFETRAGVVGLDLMDYIQQMRLKCTVCSSANQKLLYLHVPSDQPIRCRVICIWEDGCQHAFHISSSVWEYHGGFVG